MVDFLSRDTNLAFIGADLVILDSRSNAYFCMAGVAPLLKLEGSRLSFRSPDLRNAFVGAGLITSEAPAEPSARAPQVERDLQRRIAEHPRILDVAVILLAWLTMLFSYHGRSFGHLVRTAERQRTVKQAIEPDAEVRRLTAAFERVLPWLPLQEVCLYRSFLLRRVLRWRGRGTRWVFGVQTWPFHAHCWLQVGDTALDDTADRLAAYEPILVV